MTMIGLNGLSLWGNRPFSPADLFVAGEQGAWYDPSDINTYTAQSGPELIVNGNFSNGTTGWSATNATLSAASNQLTITSTSNFGIGASTGFTTVVGRWYKASATLVSCSSATARIRKTDSATDFNSNPVHLVNTGGWYNGQIFTVYFQATATTTYIMGVTDLNPSNITIANVSVVETIGVANATLFQDSAGTTPVTAVEQAVGLMLDKSGRGNHAFQTTSASRPTLRARYNLLTRSEEFNDAAWTKGSTSTAANTTAVTDPLGGTTADLYSQTAGSPVLRQAITLTAASFVTASCYFRKDVGDFVYFFCSDTATLSNGFRCFLNVSTGQKGTEGTVGSGASFTSASVQNVGNGWYRLTITGQVGAATTQISVGLFVTATDNTGTRLIPGSVYVWGAQLVPTAVFPSNTYQRIGAATDYATGAAFPVYLAADGIDDGLLTNSIDFTGTDKMLVVAGVTKNAAGVGQLVELSAAVSVNNGAFSMPSDSGTNNWGTASKGTGSVLIAESATNSYPAPITTVNSGIHNLALSSNVATLRVNGAQVAVSGAGAGGGNFGNYPLYIGRRNNASLPFNGNIYSLVIAGAAYSAGQISSTESWVAAKTPLGTI